jgi:hypothetical protein
MSTRFWCCCCCELPNCRETATRKRGALCLFARAHTNAHTRLPAGFGGPCTGRPAAPWRDWRAPPSPCRPWPRPRRPWLVVVVGVDYCCCCWRRTMPCLMLTRLPLPLPLVLGWVRCCAALAWGSLLATFTVWLPAAGRRFFVLAEGNKDCCRFVPAHRYFFASLLFL